jgi:hypothetical protein
VPQNGGKRLKAQNAGGFRYRGSLPSPLVVALTSNSSELECPDLINPFTRQLTYFGDNRSPEELNGTHLGGNRIPEESFAQFPFSSDARLSLSVFLDFTKLRGFMQQFRDLVVPSEIGVSTDDHLTAIWQTKDGARIQNYRAVFTVLDIP